MNAAAAAIASQGRTSKKKGFAKNETIRSVGYRMKKA
jgi:hypothetical protein